VVQPALSGVAAAARAAAAKTAANVAFQAKIPWIQTVLNSVDGTGLAVDGMYGSGTRAAVQAFRARRGIPDEGVLGQRTETALIQATLNRLGASGVRENGVRDQATNRAIIAYQRSKGIAADGIVGPSTRAAMMADLAY
jgi:peptidoglycan hydrolase-like protein with peptidoglycan-binding domain